MRRQTENDAVVDVDKFISLLIGNVLTTYLCNEHEMFSTNEIFTIGEKKVEICVYTTKKMEAACNIVKIVN